MSKYQKNNLVFRISSSDAISKFKSAQASAFFQLARKELNFSESARETVLLEYDRFSNWLFKIEKLCISINEKSIPESTRDIIVESFSDELTLVEDVMRKNMDIFSKDILAFTKVIHSYTREVYSSIIQESLDQVVTKSFSTLTERINDYLQHVLVSMHEYNSNIVIDSESPFVTITDFCINISRDGDISKLPCTKRIDFYLSKRKNIRDLVVKNYSSKSVDDEILNRIKIDNISFIKENHQEELV